MELKDWVELGLYLLFALPGLFAAAGQFKQAVKDKAYEQAMTLAVEQVQAVARLPWPNALKKQTAVQAIQNRLPTEFVDALPDIGRIVEEAWTLVVQPKLKAYEQQTKPKAN